MKMSIELEREGCMTVSHWEGFLRLARSAGANDDTKVSEVMCTGSDDVIHSYRVEVPEAQAAEPESVSLPTFLLHDLLSIVKEVAKSDGDVRGLEPGAETALLRTYDHLLRPVIGDNPYAAAESITDSLES